MSQSLVPGAAQSRPSLTRSGAATPEPGIAARQRDFLLLTIFVLAQQGYIDRAGLLAEALHAMGQTGADVQLARSVLRFLAGEWAAALTCLEELDRIEPIERFGAYQLTERQRMRRYLAARCLFELGENERARDVLDIYLRNPRKRSETSR